MDIDISAETCPLTYVRTRLALDRLQTGDRLRVRLRGADPKENIPRTAADQGHEVLDIEDAPDGTTIILLQKG